MCYGLRVPDAMSVSTFADDPLQPPGEMSASGLGRVKTVRPRETCDAKLNLACCHNCELESTWRARSPVSDLVAPKRMPMRTPHVWIAAMRGFTPRMLMTRVRIVGEHVQGHLGGNLRQALH